MNRFQFISHLIRNSCRVLGEALQAAVFRISTAIFLVVSFSAFALAAEPAAAPASETLTAESIINASTPAAVTFMISILILKVTAFVLGYLIVRLGHDTLIKGVTGSIDFGFSGSGFKTKLKSASPGALFVLMGAAIILWGLTVEKPMEIKTVNAPQKTIEQSTQQKSDTLHRAKVPN